MGAKARREQSELVHIHADLATVTSQGRPRDEGGDEGKTPAIRAAAPLGQDVPARAESFAPINYKEWIARCRLVIAHHAGYSIKPVEDLRLFAFATDTAVIPIEALEDALRLSRQTWDGNYTPPVGAVIESARSLYGKAPAWYGLMKRGKMPCFTEE